MDTTFERYTAGETAEYGGVLRYPPAAGDDEGDPIPKSDIAKLEVTLTNAADGQIVNGREAQSLLDANDGQVNDTSGGFRWKIQRADTDHVGEGFDFEEHDADFVLETVSGHRLTWRHRMHCSRVAPLCAWTDVLLSKADLDPGERLWVELLIGAATRTAEEIARRSLRGGYTEAHPVTEVHSVRRGQRSIRVRHWPVTKIVSVKDSLTGDFEHAAPLSVTSYAMSTPETLRLRDDVTGFQGGPGTVELKLAGGFARSAGAVPEHIRVATIRQVIHWLDTSGSPAATGRSVGSMSSSYAAPSALLPEVAAAYRTLRSRIPL
ncbi:hypothetical protein K2Z84_05365 [Candidatus Binatia bacterium]|nr:hypothetical protein [Candidatus Binatia bacterium]